jgi:hypothetical protein
VPAHLEGGEGLPANASDANKATPTKKKHTCERRFSPTQAVKAKGTDRELILNCRSQTPAVEWQRRALAKRTQNITHLPLEDFFCFFPPHMLGSANQPCSLPPLDADGKTGPSPTAPSSVFSFFIFYFFLFSLLVAMEERRAKAERHSTPPHPPSDADKPTPRRRDFRRRRRNHPPGSPTTPPPPPSPFDTRRPASTWATA